MLEGHPATNTFLDEVPFLQEQLSNTDHVLCVGTLIQGKWKTSLKRNRWPDFAYNTRATGMSAQRVVHAGLSISRFIFHSVLMP